MVHGNLESQKQSLAPLSSEVEGKQREILRMRSSKIKRQEEILSLRQSIRTAEEELQQQQRSAPNVDPESFKDELHAKHRQLNELESKLADLERNNQQLAREGERIRVEIDSTNARSERHLYFGQGLTGHENCRH